MSRCLNNQWDEPSKCCPTPVFGRAPLTIANYLLSLSTMCTFGTPSFRACLSFSVGVSPNASSALSESVKPKMAYAITPPPIRMRVRGVSPRYDLHLLVRMLFVLSASMHTYCQRDMVTGGFRVQGGTKVYRSMRSNV